MTLGASAQVRDEVTAVLQRELGVTTVEEDAVARSLVTSAPAPAQ